MAPKLQVKSDKSSKLVRKNAHLRVGKVGWQIEYSRQGVQTVWIYFGGRNNNLEAKLPINLNSAALKYMELQPMFRGQLPYGIHYNWTPKTTVMYLGEPTAKSRDSLEMTYNHLGVSLVFHPFHRSVPWHQSDNAPIYYIYVFRPSQGLKCGGGCDKKVEWRCKCGIVGYCQADGRCRKVYGNAHNVFCVDVE